MNARPLTIILSRTDNLGDVVLTLPLAGLLKQHLPGVRVLFIGKAYTRPLIEACHHVDAFLDREALLANPAALVMQGADAIVFVYPDRELAQLSVQAGVPLRVGTSHRWHHWRFLNRLVHGSRRRSNRHEVQLNARLLAPLGLPFNGDLVRIPALYGLAPTLPTPPNLLSEGQFNLVLHPKSKGSAREWPLAHYHALAASLPADRFRVLVTGTAAEGDLIRQQCPALLQLPHVTDLTGLLSLAELIALLAAADGIVACSTGPLHIAAALGRFALGLYPPMRPLHPGRWAPVGARATTLVLDKVCDDCRHSLDCACLNALAVAQVRTVVLEWAQTGTFAEKIPAQK